MGDQLAAKRRLLIEALAPVGATAERVAETVPSPRLRGYRNQARLVFRRMSRGGASHVGLGLYLPGTHRVVHIPRCPIQPDLVNAIGQSVTHLAEKFDLSVYDERHGTGVLRYLAVRTDRARRHALVSIIVGENIGPPLQALAGALRERHPEIVGVHLHVNARHSNVLFAGEDAWTAGAARLEDEMAGLRIFVSPRSFLQVNHEQAEWIYRRIKEELGAPAADATHEEIILDLYTGIGTIALHLARSGRQVIGIEESSDAVEDARRAAHANDIRDTRFVAARVEDFLRDPKAFDVDLEARPLRAVVLNPPRAGVRHGVMEAIAALAPEQILYVSCRVASLARDLEILAPAYAVESSIPVDMIPLTPHVESLTILRRRSAELPVESAPEPPSPP